ncbi:SusC/RagA family TonB-linked outer membrane protein [Phocaeicola vulgatus]|uniref:TonB-dependent receptor n=1 Tax=Phocaeicola vulgatus TaxID=821 RepID=UPI000E450CFC|nr:TonB-dependent receptor [Phocaeicola vulgatus]RGM90187.1 SusC/RagA family TonB-linked outer membrane protein [Phocaeicola vulgatus]RGN09412.1 SusC/RagA family TonB-linked outer membrane protein [Phocaeicola vulgatus]
MKNILYQESIVEIKHLFRMMRNTLLALFVFAGTAFATESYSQTMKVTVVADNVSTGKVISEIEKQTDYLFVYNVNEVNLKRNVKVNAQNKSVAEVLNKVFEGTDIYYAMEGKNIMLMSKAKDGEAVQQANKVTGIVKDANGEPVIGANVMVKGQSIGTITDIDGRFVLDAPKDAVLQITYIGYVSQEVKVSGKKEINVVLKEDTETLDEVVVIGYGTAKKSDLTGATTQIKPEALTSSVVENALESLQGKAAGVAVFNDNKPGASPSIRVRGSGSITASNEPLYVVDGFPLMDGNISDLNPSDIESMEILKDASSTAIYGSRGANGIVMITTKKGKSGTKNLSVNTSVGVQMPGRLANLISGEDFISFMNAGYKNQGSNIPFSDIPSTYTTDTNWEKEILENSSLLQDYSITFDGSSNKTNYMLSTGFYNQEGLLKAQNYQKYTFHGNLQHSFNKWLTVGANTQFTYSIQDVFDSALIDIYRYGWPTENVKNEDDTYNISSMHNTYILYPWNPVLDMNETTTQFTTNRFLGTLFAEMQLMKDLKYRLNLGVDLKNTRKYNYVGSESAVNKASGLKGNGYNNWNKGFSKVMENILTYNHTWNKHRLTATAVYSWQDFTYEDINLSGSGFENDLTGAWSMGLADKSSVSWGTNKYSNKLISFTGRVSYVYDDKYLLTATSRWDGSSRFGANNKWGYFPSVGLGWRLSQESFLKENKVITNLKIRGSFGITGNQEIGNYKSLAQLTGSNYTDGSSVIYGFKESIGNGDLKWERTTQFDLGFDLSLWNRMDIAFDYYTRNTNDLLYNVPIPSTSGYSSILSNIGKVTNKGWELSVGGNIMQNKDFNLYASVNVTYNQNKIKELYGGVDEVAVRYEAGGLARVLKVGNSVDAIYARHSLGIIKTQEQLDEYKKKVPNTAANAQLGDEMYEDIDGDGSISSNDYVCLGSVQPKYFYGLNLSMEYKGFGLSVYGQGGHKYASIAGAEDYYANNSAWAMSYANLTSYLLYGENQISNNVYIPTQYAYEHMWSPENPNGNYPTAGAHDVYLSDRTNANWRYFILRNIQFNYDLAPLLNIKSVKSLKVNLNFQNFVTFANHRGYNPINGDTSNPWAKSIILGINAKF